MAFLRQWVCRAWLPTCRTSTAASSPSTRFTGLFAHRLFLEPCDKKTTYDTHNTTTVLNITSYENITQVENVTITETIIQLENITTQENVSVLINETVRYNATYVSPSQKFTSSRRPRVIAGSRLASRRGHARAAAARRGFTVLSRVAPRVAARGRFCR